MAQASVGAETENLKALIFQRLHPRLYLERFLGENIRPDGRSFDEWREMSMNVGSISTADGSALVRLGNTTVVCGVKAKIAEPELDRPEEGFLVPNIDLPAMCSPKFKPGPPGEEAQVLADQLNEILLVSGTVPLSSLCIHPGKSAWVLYVDAVCINYDGNVLDAALIAMVAALNNTRLPQATFDEETGRTICSRQVMAPLPLTKKPVSMSFGLFNSNKSCVLADPTSFEEPLLDSTLVIVVDDDNELLSVSLVGLSSPSEDILSACITAAKRRHSSLGRQVYG